METQLKRHGIVLVITLLAGCGSMRGDGSSDVTLRAEPTTAAPGGNSELILNNGSNIQIGYNLCTSGLERMVTGSWQQVPSNRICTMQLGILEPSQSTRYTIQLPTDLGAGDYRWVATLHRMTAGEGFTVTSNTFRLQR
jgi:hypothetical protein